MTMVYPTDMSHCALCERHIHSTQHLGLYLVGARAALGYALCETCGKQAQRGLPPDQLRKLDQNLERQAEQFGLTQTH
jgi:hypothetical protein